MEPRPVTQEDLDSRYRDAAEDYCLVNPGMTDLWQVSGRSERGFGVRIRLGPLVYSELVFVVGSRDSDSHRRGCL